MIKLNFSCRTSATFKLTVNQTLSSQGVTAIYGHSGSGKTTLLRSVAGLETPAGEIIVNATHWLNEHAQLNLPTHKRSLGYVFQEASLFEHLCVKRNLHYAVKRAKHAQQKISFEKVVEVLAIAPLMAKYPVHLSGGERQRVAIARALLSQPDVLLMDEPLSSLDNARKQEVLPYLRSLSNTFGVPILYVTHDLAEVAQLADYVLVLEHGKIKQAGAVSEVLIDLQSHMHGYDEQGVVIETEVIRAEPKWGVLCTCFDAVELYIPDHGQSLGSRVRVRILPRDVSISLKYDENSSILNILPACIRKIDVTDPVSVLLQLQIGRVIIYARITHKSLEKLDLVCGMHVFAQIKTSAAAW